MSIKSGLLGSLRIIRDLARLISKPVKLFLLSRDRAISSSKYFIQFIEDHGHQLLPGEFVIEGQLAYKRGITVPSHLAKTRGWPRDPKPKELIVLIINWLGAKTAISSPRKIQNKCGQQGGAAIIYNHRANS